MNKTGLRIILSALALGALSVWAIPTSAQDKKLPKLRWFGQSFFVIETSQGTRIAIDPHMIEAFGRQTSKADLVLMSHPHPDHVNLEAIENRTKAKTIEGIKIPMGSVPEGGPTPRAKWNPVDEQFKDVRIRSVGTYHDTMQGLRRGLNTIFILEFDGIRLVHLGDLGHLLNEEQLRSIGPVDVLLIPVGGVYTINGEQAKKVLAQLKPRKYVIPMHYGTRFFDDLMPPDEFLDGQKNVEKRLTTNEMTLDPAFKPEEPVIVLLSWKKDG